MRYLLLGLRRRKAIKEKPSLNSGLTEARIEPEEGGHHRQGDDRLTFG